MKTYTTDVMKVLSFAASELENGTLVFIGHIPEVYTDTVRDLGENLYRCEDLLDNINSTPPQVHEEVLIMCNLLQKEDCAYFRVLK